MREPEYDVVDDQKEVLSVRILPARPINDDREYADRDLPWTSSNMSVSSAPSCRTTPGRPPREIPQVPAVNREVKPGRRKTKLDRRPAPLEPGDHVSHGSSSPSAFTAELTKHLSSRFTLQETSSNDRRLRSTENADFSSQLTASHRATSVSPPVTHQRHSLDLETHDLDKRVHQNLERVPSRRHHHEWPQTKEDIDQNEFVPMWKPQTYCEEDWYVGDCNRIDAEHALHLVNKDGAFLVRDCSNNTNSEPLVLVVYHEKRVYNVKIRFIEANRKYALGNGQRSNDMFDSVAEIIKFHSIFPVTLVSGRNTAGSKYPENCVLTCPITKMDVEQLLQ